MKKTLTAITMATALTVATLPAKTQEAPKLNDLLAQCMDKTNSLKEENRRVHYLFPIPGSGIVYNRTYVCDKKIVIEQYMVSPQPLENGTGDTYFQIAPRPYMYGVDGAWYSDPTMDGINGNEILMEDSGKTSDDSTPRIIPKKGGIGI